MTFNMNMNTWRRHRRDLTGGALMVVVLAAGAFVFWYRAPDRYRSYALEGGP